MYVRVCVCVCVCDTLQVFALTQQAFSELPKVFIMAHPDVRHHIQTLLSEVSAVHALTPHLLLHRPPCYMLLYRAF